MSKTVTNSKYLLAPREVGRAFYGGKLSESILDKNDFALLVGPNRIFFEYILERMNTQERPLSIDIVKIPDDAMDDQTQNCIVHRESDEVMAVVINTKFAEQLVDDM